MSAKEVYTYDIRCPDCDMQGTVTWSEYKRPTLYSGHGRHLKEISKGFLPSATKDIQGDPRIICIECLCEFDA